MTRRRTVPLAALPALLLALSACASTFTPAAAIINGVRITQSTFDGQLSVAKGQQQRGGQGLDDAELSRQVLGRMIHLELIRQEAARRSLSVAPADVDRSLDEVRSSFPSQDEFQQAMTQQGLTLEILREQLYQTLLSDQLAAAIAGPVGEEQIREVYEQERSRFEERTASHILVQVQDQSRDAAARQRADRIKRRIDRGESFTTLARRFSDDPGSAQQGGRLGVINESFDATFANAVFAADQGDVVGPVRTQFGYHVIRVDKVTVRTLDESRAEIVRTLRGQLRQRVLSEFLIEQAPKAAIKINPRYGDWDTEQAAVVPHQSFVPAPPETDPNAPPPSPEPQLPPGLGG